MTYSEGDLIAIFSKTNGLCRHCRTELVFKNYGSRHDEGGWEVDHSNPKANGGTDLARNLFPLCWECNVEKADTRGDIFDDDFERETPGGKIIDDLNLVKNHPFVTGFTLGTNTLIPDLPEGALGSSPKRKKS